ncbi:unnamed protein product [Brassicogethes aeneus]|uniref:RING-type E3 ubiquitin transferase n=1 Tax=Brassicogethes aeneus TaxID=1431903 RepID=A0A9P0FIX1_BRAAE|nr:unnamed protein product [Brassicogethes aeneus]
MATDVSTNLNDNLLKEKIFNCKICDELCISDIFLIIGKGNVCSKCYEECEDKSRAELNSALIFVMSQLILLCKYEFKGCIKKLTCKNYERHINVCEYKVKPCPMLMYEDCKWNGNNLEISEHISTEHTEHVIKSENNIFKVETSLSETYNIKLLIDDYKSCLLRTSIVDNKFYYAMNPIFQCEETVEYSVKHKSKETQNSSTTVGTLTKLNSIYGKSNLHKNPNATIVDMELLKHFADENNSIENEFNLNPSDIDEKTLKLLECPVCFHTMRPPIYQCSSGHSICIVCRDKIGNQEQNQTFGSFGIFGAPAFGAPAFGACSISRLKKCPTCQAEWTKTRNYLIEGLTNNLKYPCQFKKLGCKVFGTEPQVSKHEESCPFHIYKCPMSCPESGNFEFLLKHLNNKHKDMQLTTKLSFRFQESSTRKWTLYDSKLFIITYYCTHSDYMNWVAELYCSNENPSSYIYTVEVLKSGSEWSLIKNAECLKKANLQERNDKMSLECKYATFNITIKKNVPQ